MRKGFLVSGLFVLAVFSLKGFATQGYYSDEQLLNPDKKHIYIQVQEILNDWSGESEKLDDARGRINSFLANDHFFLPMHIENARRTIMAGYVGGGDVRDANVKALKITQWIQKRDAKYAKSYVLAGHIYTNLQQYSEATKSLDIAEELGSSDPWLYINRATLLVAQRNYEEAIGYYQRAITLDGVSDKALLAAISGLSNIAKVSPSDQAVNYSEIIFKEFNDPLKRIRIAKRLVNSYQGQGEVLQVAYHILSRQKQETPGLALVDVEMAHLILVSGFKYREGFRTLYVPKSADAAEDMASSLWRKADYSGDVFGILFDVAMSKPDFNRAEALLRQAQSYGVSEAKVLYAQSLLYFERGEYEAVISTYEKLEKIDPAYIGGELLATAYQQLGDVGKLQEYHKKAIERSPDVAWVRGDYAVFLMYYMDAPSEAIKYGESALEIMDYPAARNITGLAYLVEASKSLTLGKDDLARQQYDRAAELGVSDKYVQDYCRQNCDAISSVRAKFSTTPKAST